ncbi:MAG: hypothetical protein CUN56_17295, partial [Phototrophicales bacterium]
MDNEQTEKAEFIIKQCIDHFWALLDVDPQTITRQMQIADPETVNKQIVEAVARHECQRFIQFCDGALDDCPLFSQESGFLGAIQQVREQLEV